jgi:hypothetical protein
MAKKKINKKPVAKKAPVKKAPVKKVVAKKPVASKAEVKKPVSKKVRKQRKPSKTTLLKLQNAAEEKLRELRKKERPYIRYSFHIESIEVDGNNIIEEIVYNYRGTMIIPKSQKENYKSGFAEVVGVYIVPKDLDSIVRRVDFKQLKRKDIMFMLARSVREDHKKAMQEIISKELMPQNKKISDLPWKY